MYTYVYRECGGLGSISHISLPSYFVRQALSVSAQLYDWSDYLTNKLWGSSCLYPPRARAADTCDQPSFL